MTNTATITSLTQMDVKESTPLVNKLSEMSAKACRAFPIMRAFVDHDRIGFRYDILSPTDNEKPPFTCTFAEHQPQSITQDMMDKWVREAVPNADKLMCDIGMTLARMRAQRAMLAIAAETTNWEEAREALSLLESLDMALSQLNQTLVTVTDKV